MLAKKQRHDIRLRLGKGVVFLRCRGIPAAACTLIELSEGGCRCLAPIQNLDAESAERWKKNTEPGRQMSIDVSAPPHLPGIHLDVEIKHAAVIESGELELGLNFLHVEADERELLSQALQAFAAEKLETASPPPCPESSGEFKATLADSGIIRRQYAAFNAPAAARKEEPPAAPVKDPRKESRTAQAVRNWFAPPEVVVTNDPYRGKRLGEILKDLGKIGDDQISEAREATHSVGEKFGQYLLRSGWISPMDLCSALSLQSGLPMVDLADVGLDAELAKVFSSLMMLRHEFIPFKASSEQLCIATAHPMSRATLTDLEQRCGKKIKVFLGEDDQIMKALYALQPSKDRKLRKQKRQKLSVPVTFRFLNRQQGFYSEESYTGRTLDVSETGLMICTAHDLKRHGTCLQVRFSLPPDNFEAICSIRYLKGRDSAESAELPWVLGLQIMDISPDYRRQLKEICVRAGMWNLKDRRDGQRK